MDPKKTIYIMAKEFLITKIWEYISKPEIILDSYTKININTSQNSINIVMKRLIESLKNRNQMAKVINIDINKIEFDKIICNYNPQDIYSKYWENFELLLQDLKEIFIIKNIDSSRNLWRIFSHWILSGAKFLNLFQSWEDFNAFVNVFWNNVYTKAALPMLLEKEIFWFWFALACDFLKELWYVEYPKPDIHLIDILTKTNISSSNNIYDIYKDMINLSNLNKVTAYEFDKILWLIGSWNLYNHDIKLWNNKSQFIEYYNNSKLHFNT